MGTHHDLVGDVSYNSNLFGCSSSGWHHEGGKELASSLLFSLGPHHFGGDHQPWVSCMDVSFNICSMLMFAPNIIFPLTSPTLVEVAIVKPFGGVATLAVVLAIEHLDSSSALLVVVSPFNTTMTTFVAILHG
jgi:hypothetical protein